MAPGRATAVRLMAAGCPGLAACWQRRQHCGHAARVADYRDARLAWELRREAEVPGMYPTEVREWEGVNPGLTFRDYLIMTRDTRR